MAAAGPGLIIAAFVDTNFSVIKKTPAGLVGLVQYCVPTRLPRKLDAKDKGKRRRVVTRVTVLHRDPLLWCLLRVRVDFPLSHKRHLWAQPKAPFRRRFDMCVAFSYLTH